MSGRLAALARHSFVRFAAIGVLSYLVDLGALIGLRSGLHMPLTAATVAAYAFGFLVNFGLNRAFAFENTGAVGPQLVKYVILVVLNLLATVVIVDGLSHVWAYYAGSKTIASLVNSLFNYVAYRFWVFRAPVGPAPATGSGGTDGDRAAVSADVGEEVA